MFVSRAAHAPALFAVLLEVGVTLGVSSAPLAFRQLNASLAGVIRGAPKGDFPHHDTMTCKRNATLPGAEGGCQAEIVVASATGAAFFTQAHGFDPHVVADAADSSLEHRPGMTCNPVSGCVPLPCSERRSSL